MSGQTSSKAKATKEPRTPREFLRRDLRNTRIFLPRVDFNDIRVGAKTEFRNYGHRIFNGLEHPTPAIGYHAKPWWTPTHGLEGIDTVALTLEDSWVEPLGAIGPESLEREGFDSIEAFRRYFAERYPNGGFRALANVVVYRVHPMTLEETAAFAAEMWARLYGRLT